MRIFALFSVYRSIILIILSFMFRLWELFPSSDFHRPVGFLVFKVVHDVIANLWLRRGPSSIAVACWRVFG